MTLFEKAQGYNEARYNLMSEIDGFISVSVINGSEFTITSSSDGQKISAQEVSDMWEEAKKGESSFWRATSGTNFDGKIGVETVMLYIKSTPSGDLTAIELVG